MLDIKFLRSNPDVVKQNIKNKFQDEKLPLVDEVIELDKRNREIKQEVEALRAEKNKASKEIGAMMAQKKLEEAEALKKKVAESNGRINELSEEEKEDLFERIEQGDLLAREHYIKGNLRLVLSIIQRFSGSSENADDLFQEYISTSAAGFLCTILSLHPNSPMLLPKRNNPTGAAPHN